MGPRTASRGPAGPSFDIAASGAITLDQTTGKLGETTTIWQDFRPTNPHLGDAIVATFYFVGSTNIITRVYDHLSDAAQTPVGNTYTLVDFVTAGGVSAATYVATNVQNFPEGTFPDGDQNLVVHADLASPIQDGGITIAAFRGVSADAALAAHQTATGTGSSYPAVADAGELPADDGALVYAVTMSSSGRGAEVPLDFTSLGTQTSPSMWIEPDYGIQVGAGTVHPQWNWSFDSTGTWLTSALVLRPAATQLAFTVQPSTTLPLMTIQPAVKVTALDAAGDVATSFNGPITIAIGHNAGLLMPGTLSGTKTVNAVNGVATFTDLSIDQAGNGYTLTVKATGLTGAESAPFNIGPL
ncbi:MAG TPA: hypothetical protein VG454_10835 [Gemmatimonadales bacterium]|nr:hypothetical protein [Gemmatimonadales bacterium]